jgi:hypothetical protein
MARSDFKARAVRQKTREVVEYHRDTERPGKPLFLMIPCGLLALGALVAIFGVVRQTWIDHVWEESRGIATLIVLLPVYVGCVFGFSYGYELYDTERALKLTAWIVFLTVGIVVVVAVLFCLFSGSSDNKSDNGGSKSKSKSGGSSSGGSSSGSLLDNLFSSSPSTTTSGSPVAFDVNLFPTTTTTSTVDAPAELPRPQPVACKFCKSEFIPEENEFKCPNCGASSRRTEEETTGDSE